MTFIGTIRQALSGEPAMPPAAIDVAIDACEAAATAATPHPPPLPPAAQPTPSAAVATPLPAASTPKAAVATPKANAQRMPSESAGKRQGSGSGAPAKRGRSRYKGAAPPPLVRIERTEARLPVEGNQPSPREQAIHVLRCLKHSGFRPGAAIPYRQLKAIYQEVCDGAGWAAVGWSGKHGIGTQLRQLCGGGKSYLNSWRGTEPTYALCKREPIYVLPRWSDVPGLIERPSAGRARGAGSSAPGTVTSFPAGRKRRAAA